MSLDDTTSAGAQHLFNIVRRNVLLMGEMLAASIDKTTFRVAATSTQIDLVALAKDVASLIQPVLKTRRQTVTVTSSGRVAHVVGDHGGLARVVINLLDNASKYGPVGDALAVRVANRGNDVLVSVVDHGPGVPAGERNAVFRAFYRTDAARRSNAPGIGLGLSVVRELVAAHGGTVGVSRVRGETRVWFSLPNKHIGVRAE